VEGYEVDAVLHSREALERLEQTPMPIVISDIYLDERTGLDVLEAARRMDPACAVILMTARGTMETVMAATKGGASITSPSRSNWTAMLETVKRAEAVHGRADGRGGSRGVARDRDDRQSAADGRDLQDTRARGADRRHRADRRRNGHRQGVGGADDPSLVAARAQAFVPVDCASIAPSLLESELFGALKGSYTGADRDRIGVFEAAHRGTVFLDEIGEIELGFQLKLLRFLQEREVRPLGASRAKPVDVRVVAATNRDLKKMVEDGKFRQDLWFRLNVVRLKCCPR
jgi:DNA-binding NtrC family response regulator